MLGQVELFPITGRLDFKVLGVHLCYHNFSRDEKVVGTEHKQPYTRIRIVARSRTQRALDVAEECKTNEPI